MNNVIFVILEKMCNSECDLNLEAKTKQRLKIKTTVFFYRVGLL